MQITPDRPSIFSHLSACQDAQTLILSYVSKDDLATLAKVSKTMCKALHELTAPFLNVAMLQLKDCHEIIPLPTVVLDFENEIPTPQKAAIKRDLQTLSTQLYIGFFANLSLWRLGMTPHTNLNTFAEALDQKLNTSAPWLGLAQEYLQKEDIAAFEYAWKKVPPALYKDGHILSSLLDTMCAKKQYRQAIDFYKISYRDLFHSNEMQQSLETISTSLLEHKKWEDFGYMIEQIAPDNEKTSLHLKLLEAASSSEEWSTALKIADTQGFDPALLGETDQASLLIIYLKRSDFKQAWDLLGELPKAPPITDQQLYLLELIQEIALEQDNQAEAAKASRLLTQLTSN